MRKKTQLLQSSASYYATHTELYVMLAYQMLVAGIPTKHIDKMILRAHTHIHECIHSICYREALSLY